MKKFYSQRFIVSVALCCIYLIAWAQVPDGYYDGADGKSGAALKTALYKIITKNLNPPEYGSGKTNSTWAAFEKMDRRPDGSVWDMYSDEHRKFTGNGTAPSGMNIEHSMANSWWGKTRNNAYNDVLQLRPSDITANSKKQNYIMSVVNSVTWTNGCIKIGKTTLPGKSINAWEPADEYKGDFARIYMYMVTCYEDFGISGKWRSAGLDQLENNAYPVFKDWTTTLLLKWNKEDPVSDKEITLNNEGCKIQGNRNPFIDYPELAEYIWGDKKTEPYYPTAISSGVKDSTISIIVFDGKVRIHTDARYEIVRIYDVVGRLIKQTIIDAGDTEFSLPSGIYIVNGHKVAL